MDRRSFIKKAGLMTGGAAAATSLAAPAIAQSMPEIKWRLTSSFPKALDTIFGAAERLRQDRSPRRPTASSRSRPSPPTRSCPASRPLDAVSDGTVEMCHTASYYYWGKDPTFAFGTAVPFGLNSRQQNAWMYEAAAST